MPTAGSGRHAANHARPLPNLHHGAAGIGLYLVALHAATGEPRYREAAAAAGRWILARLRSPVHLRCPGLYFGDAGAAWFLWRLGWRDEARALAEQVAALPRERVDITHGAAGVGLLQLLVGDLGQAVAIGDWLLAQAPPVFYGFAHGTAGIAYFLLELYRQSGVARFRDRAVADLQALLAAATPLPGCHGLSWQQGPSDSTLWPHWCNGASGVGYVFLRAYQSLGEPAWLETAQRAGLAAYHGSRGGPVVQCHGTAGNAELLLDLYQATGERTWLERAHSLAALVSAQAVHRDGALLWPCEGAMAITPELMTGYTGVGAWFLRLSEPERRPRLVELPR